MRSYIVPEIHQIFCRLKCFNTVHKHNMYNMCSCHPECKKLNYDPCIKPNKTYQLLYSRRNCDCPDDTCKFIYPYSDIHSK